MDAATGKAAGIEATVVEAGPHSRTQQGHPARRRKAMASQRREMMGGRGGEVDCLERRRQCCHLEEKEAKANDCKRKPERGRGGLAVGPTEEEEADDEEGRSWTSGDRSCRWTANKERLSLLREGL
ncbi:hypothetical protein GW17_00058502 [Ensete ventricosum]|nr:hypothetical protein GW17_00058502 [Ensete ventricosum]